MLPGPAVEHSLLAWIGEPHVVPGCVAGRGRSGNEPTKGPLGRRGWHENYPVCRNVPASKEWGRRTPRA